MHKYYYTFIIETQSFFRPLLLTHKNYYSLYYWRTRIITLCIVDAQIL